MPRATVGLPYSFFLDRYADSYVNVMDAFVKYVKTGDESLEPALGADGKITIFIGEFGDPLVHNITLQESEVKTHRSAVQRYASNGMMQSII